MGDIRLSGTGSMEEMASYDNYHKERNKTDLVSLYSFEAGLEANKAEAELAKKELASIKAGTRIPELEAENEKLLDVAVAADELLDIIYKLDMGPIILQLHEKDPEATSNIIVQLIRLSGFLEKAGF